MFDGEICTCTSGHDDPHVRTHGHERAVPEHAIAVTDPDAGRSAVGVREGELSRADAAPVPAGSSAAGDGRTYHGGNGRAQAGAGSRRFRLPPFPVRADHADPRSFAVALFERMAASVKDTLAATIAREKSRNWAVGRMARAYPDVEVRHLRAVIEELRVEQLGRAVDERENGERPTELQLRSRRPVSFLEPLEFPCWQERAERLREIVGADPIAVLDLFARTAGRGWSENRTKNTIAAAETLGRLHYDRARCVWQREPVEHEQDHGVADLSASPAGGVGVRTATEAVSVAAKVASEVRVLAAPPISRRLRGRAPSPATRAANHPWRPRLMTSQAPSLEPKNGKPSNASATSTAPVASSEKSAGAGSGDAKPRKKPGPPKGSKMPKRAAQAATASDLDGALEKAIEAAIEPAVRRVLGRVIGKVVSKAIGEAVGT